MSIKNLIQPITYPGLDIAVKNFKIGDYNMPSSLGPSGKILMSDGGSNLVFGTNVKNLINSAIYRPGGVSQDNIFSLWSEVVSFINATNGDVLLYMDDSISSPCIVSESVDLQSRVQILPYRNSINAPTVKIQDGVSIINPSYLNGPMLFVATPTLATPFVMTQNLEYLFLSQNVSFKFDGVPTLPFIESTETVNVVMALFRGSNLDNSLAPSSPLFKIGPNAFGVCACALGGDYGTDTISGDLTSSLFLVHDASASSPTLGGFSGTRQEQIFDKADSLFYDDSASPNLVPSPSIPGSPSVQNAIDAIKSMIVNLLTVNNLTATGTSTLTNCTSTNLSVTNETTLSFCTSSNLSVTNDTTLNNCTSSHLSVTNEVTCDTLSVLNQPILSMYCTSTQTVTLNTLTTITFDTVETNIGGITFSSLTNTFTIPSDGLYSISYSLIWNVASGSLTNYVEKNNSSLYNHYSYTIVNMSMVRGLSGSFTTRFNAGDTLQYFLTYASGPATITIGPGGAGTNKFIISKIC